MKEETKRKISLSLKGRMPKNIEMFKRSGKHFKKNEEPWNKGLTKETDERVLKYSIKNKDSHKGQKVWNEGMGLGKEYKHPTKRVNGNKYSVAKMNFLKYNKFGLFFVPTGWVVHHRDSNPTNNKIDNLIIMPHHTHSSLHNQLNAQIHRGEEV